MSKLVGRRADGYEFCICCYELIASAASWIFGEEQELAILQYFLASPNGFVDYEESTYTILDYRDCVKLTEFDPLKLL